MNNVEFLYDFSSPNCHVAHAKLKDLQTKGKIKNLSFSPVLLGGLFKSTNDSALPKGSLEYNYMAKNLERLSKTLDVNFKFSHDRFPVNSLRSMRGSYFAKESGKESEYIQEIFEACWSQDKDITQDSTLKPIIEDSLGLDFSRFLSFIEKDETKQKLRSDTQNALERGVFGAPTFFIDGDMYWGTPEILWYLENELK
ncbi:MAG: 2-hydroxychromene-2-carboxylate isomerase [archaeon]|nr:2-hydroxychromene-2-carboxylate isomerase [archaeon]